MTNIIRFPTERLPGSKAAQLAELIAFVLRAKRINVAIERLDKMANIARRSKPRFADFRRDQVEPAR